MSITSDTGQAESIQMVVDVWSDYACPWCYLGRRRLEQALEESPFAGAEVRWRAFQLDPDTPRFGEPGAGRPVGEYLREKYGDPEQIRQMQQRLTELAADEGLEYRLEETRQVNTLDAHRLTIEARAHGVAGELSEALFRAHFIELDRIDDPDVLTALAVNAGIPEDRVMAVLSGDEHSEAVEEDISTARQIGANGVPLFVFAEAGS